MHACIDKCKEYGWREAKRSTKVNVGLSLQCLRGRGTVEMNTEVKVGEVRVRRLRLCRRQGVPWFEEESWRHTSPHARSFDLTTTTHHKLSPAWFLQSTMQIAAAAKVETSLPQRSLARRAGSVREHLSLAYRTYHPFGSVSRHQVSPAAPGLCVWMVKECLMLPNGLNQFSLRLFSPSYLRRLDGRSSNPLERLLGVPWRYCPLWAQTAPSWWARAPISFSVVSGQVRKAGT